MRDCYRIVIACGIVIEMILNSDHGVCGTGPSEETETVTLGTGTWIRIQLGFGSWIIEEMQYARFFDDLDRHAPLRNEILL
uniref:Uncharacterized protein n=1 Tax=Acrobeloides nanus TaxID=290746 RepID=A0A914DFM1_9BILA